MVVCNAKLLIRARSTHQSHLAGPYIAFPFRCASDPDGWAAPKRSSPGGQPLYSDLAIGLVLTLRLVFHLALRQAEAFSSSVLRLLGLELTVPDRSTLSRRGRAFAGRQPRVRASAGPVHLVLDSTDLELFGQGEWDAEKHGRARRQ